MKQNIIIDYYKCNLKEPNINNIRIISKAKAKQAYEILKKPVFVADSGFYINKYPNKPGYPGAFVKRSGISNNIDDLLYIMKDVNDCSCYFLDCLTFYNGNEYFQFFGENKGYLSYEKRGFENKKAKSNLWYLFIPNNCTKTLAQMNDEELNNRPDKEISATDEFINWYKNYISSKKLKLKK